MIRCMCAAAAALLLCAAPAYPADVSLFITSNIEGRFSLSGDAPDSSMLILQSLYRKRAQGKPVLHLDLGNAFYPGILSRFSFGSVAYDYLDFNGCDATVVSSRDIRVGIENLLQFENGNPHLLLSANIARDDRPVFLPWTLRNAGKYRIGLVGVSGENVLFDITDRMTSNVSLTPALKAVESAVAELTEKEHPDFIIVLSGLSSEASLRIMYQLPSVSLCICGGDSRGAAASQQASRIILSDGRQLLITDSRKGYFLAECSLSEQLTVTSFSFRDPEEWKVSNEPYQRFSNRLALWRGKYLEEQSAPLKITMPGPIHITDDAAANLMRGLCRTEISILSPGTVTPFDISSSTTNADILRNVSDDFYIYRMKLKGSEITALSQTDAIQLFGFDNGRIQGRPVMPARTYTVAATQAAYERILDITENYSIPFENTWKTIPETISTCVTGEPKQFVKDASSLDDRIGFLARISLSNSFHQENVKSGTTITPPNGMVSSTHTLFNTEDSADLILYNRYHMVTFSPYVNYQKEELGTSRSLLANTMSYALLYQINTHDIYKPYVKSMYQSPIERVDGLKPTQLRETGGIDIMTEYLKGRAGAGVSKQIADPTRSALFGLEANGTFIYPFLTRMKYKCALDAFLSHSFKQSYSSLTFQLTNGVSYSITDLFAVTLSHRYTFYHDGAIGEEYRNNAVKISFDFATALSVF